MAGSFTFSQVPTADIPRSTFDRSHGHKTTFDAGYLVPVYVDEALPGDTFQLSMSAFARLATPIFPIMDNLHMDFFFFAIPNRLLWDNWVRMMGEQDNPDDSTDYLVPIMDDAGGYQSGDLFDYFGIPPGIGNLSVSALFARAYNRVWNAWFRDQNLQDAAVQNTDDGPDTVSDYPLRRRGKRHDYFTSALPWPQKGTASAIGLGGVAPVVASGTGLPEFTAGAESGPLYHDDGTAGVLFGAGSQAGPVNLTWHDPKLEADLSSVNLFTINALREAFQIQKLLERDARGGTRYIEIIKSHFGVVSPDARMQRPEFLGGGSIPVIINPVAKTASTDTESPQANLAAYGVAGGGGIGFTKSFTEHCVLLGLVSVRADLTYQQGIHRSFSRRSRYDFYWPAFAHLGEQAILQKEIFANDDGHDDDVWGYQERFAEYRYFPSKITSKFRSPYSGGLDSWHLAQEFSAAPALDDTFIQENPPVARVIAVQSEPHFLFDSHFRIRCTRPMPTYSVPGLIDHF